MSGSAIASDALVDIVHSSIAEEFNDSSPEALLKVLGFIIKNGIQQNQVPKDEERVEWLLKCLAAVEKICDTNPLLLNHQITDASITYKWLIYSLIPLLSTTDEKLVNSVKQTIITIIHCITLKLKLFTYKKKIKTYLMTTFQTYVSQLFKTTNQEKLLEVLSICSNLFSLLTDHLIRTKMMIDSTADQKFETAARKIDLVLSNLMKSSLVHQLDTIKSHMIFNTLYYSVNGDYMSLSRLRFALSYYCDTLNSPHISQLNVSSLALGFALLLTFKGCIEASNVPLFENLLRFHKIKSLNEKNSFSSTLSKVIGFIAYTLDPNDPSLKPSYNTPFQNENFERLRSDILKLLFDTDSDSSFIADLSFKADIKPDSLSSWIKAAKRSLEQNQYSDTELFKVMSSLGNAVCRFHGFYDASTHLCSLCAEPTLGIGHVDYSRKTIDEVDLIQSIYNITIRSLVPSSQGSITLTMSCLELVYKMFIHYQPVKIKKNCPIFSFLKQSFLSTEREVRTFTVRVLALYTFSKYDTHDSNFKLISDFLDEIRLDSHEHLAEAVILVWGRIAVFSEGDRLRFILQRLFIFLMSSNIYQFTVSYHELKLIATAKETTPWKLISPILPDIAVKVVQKLETKPFIGQRISDFVNVPLDSILKRTSQYTVPYLMTYYKSDLLGLIADASNEKKFMVVNENRARIVAVLVMTIPDLTEKQLYDIITNASPEYRNSQLDTIVGATTTVWEILRFYSLPTVSKNDILKGINFVLGISNLKGARAVDSFLKANILGVVQLFFESIRDRKGKQPYSEKLKDVKAIEFLSEIAGVSIVSVLPQIYTCLLAALDVELLREATLHCWAVLSQNIEEKHLVTILDQSVAVVTQYWSSFNPKCKFEGKKLLASLIDKSESFKLKHIYSFYSLAEIDELAEIYAKVYNTIKKGEKPIGLLNDIIRRANSDNHHVVKQSLIDLARFVKHYQIEFYSSFLTKSVYSQSVTYLISALLNILHRFKLQDDICVQCSKCLGLIGSLDPTKFEPEKKKDQFIISSDFEDSKEMIAFIIKFLNRYLVPAFWSSNHPNNQLFLALAMQEFLKICGLTSSKVDIHHLEPKSQEFALWSQLSDISQSTLTPLVSSKYTASVGGYENLKYPIFNASKDHSKWLRLFTLDLLKRSSFGTAGKIFEICSALIKDQNLSFSTFLLPYAVVHLIVSDTTNESVDILRTEILQVLSTDIDEVHHLATESLRLSYESIFNLLDYLRKWIFSRKQALKKKGTKRGDPAVRKVMVLIDAIPQDLMAKRSYQANSYERAILYLEQCYRSDAAAGYGDQFFGTLQTMYANINDYDSLDGVLKKFSAKTLEDRITQLEYSDNWKMAQDCFEAVGDIEQNNFEIDSNTRLIKSLFDHDLYDHALEKLDLLVEEDKFTKDWLNLALEASIMSGKLDYVQRWVERLELHDDLADEKNLMNYHIGKALLSAKDNNITEFESSLERVYLILGGRLGLNKTLSLSNSRPIMVLLHSLADVDSIMTNPSEVHRLKPLLDARLEHSGNDFKSGWTISTFRKAAITVSNIVDGYRNAAETWMSLSKIARKHNRLDLATTSIIHAISLESPGTDLEYSKLLWAQGDHSRALKLIEDLRKRNSDLPAVTPRENSAIQLKYTKWLDLSNNSNSSKIIEEFTSAIKIDPNWEKPYHYLGKYYNKLLELKSNSSLSEVINPKDIGGEFERRTISFYLKAIQCGTKYIYEDLPKLITVWLDFAEHISEVPPKIQDNMKITIVTDRKKHLQHIHDEISRASKRFPAYFWYTVFSQLLSRLLHSNKQAGQLIITITQYVLEEYPSHALWSVLAQYNSNQPERSKKAKKLIDLFSSESPNSSTSNSSILQSAKGLFNQLMGVSKKAIPKGENLLSLKDDFDFDHHHTTPSPLVVPVKTNFDITLPASVQSMKHHNPFPNSSKITIHKFENRVDVLSSMQQPRHLYLRGSNGLSYGILCKPNDDLRKDAKLMEFTTRIDHLLRKDYESEQRKLHINTYAVIPLNESHGIIEWVENSKTMREILRVHYYNHNISLDISAIKKVLDKDCDLTEKTDLFTSDILTRYPPVLYQWFIENFPDPTSWYEARNNYTRTTAVMSMVGYILGLGDRHGENLLFNEKNGGLLHVDFDCLFEKGLELAVPERVPFRLTHNMVDAFGITGVEGTFKKSCEVTLTLLRINETTLMNILESFLHDPIMDWSHKRRSKNTPQSALSTIRRKIRGILDKEGLPMSVQGQADFLIQQATSPENLCQMYIGWMAFW